MIDRRPIRILEVGNPPLLRPPRFPSAECNRGEKFGNAALVVVCGEWGRMRALWRERTDESETLSRRACC